jgi:hypothetical protein
MKQCIYEYRIRSTFLGKRYAPIRHSFFTRTIPAERRRRRRRRRDQNANDDNDNNDDDCFVSSSSPFLSSFILRFFIF